MLGTFHAEALLSALTDLHHIHEKDLLFLFVLNRSAEVLKAQGGTFFSVKEDDGLLIPEASKGVPLALLKEIQFKMKTGIAGWVATNRKGITVENVQMDERFNRAVDVITGIKTRSLLCVPVLFQNKVLGVLELVNRLDGNFREPDLQMCQHLANQVGVAIENCNLYESSEYLLAYTKSVINSLTGGFISTDSGGLVTYCNLSALRILGISDSGIIGKPLLKAISQFPAFAAILDVTQKHQSSVSRQEIELHRSDGAALLIGYSTFLIRSDASKVLGAGIIFQDITHLKKG